MKIWPAGLRFAIGGHLHIYIIAGVGSRCHSFSLCFVGLDFDEGNYYFNNPAHVTLPKSSRASCLGIVSLGAHSQVSAAASSSLVYTPHKQRGITRIDFGSGLV